ncbi:radical SAM family heme chaperone HemW [Jeotgalibacillus proteolyticus]|uniref:Heme chaperone HemW n=1 Tax=Jeotgalibacillus proteolyticus TaxID=2082395 RepID=A0A2S5GEP2_9BACL|nr:radical SAM family heme chaperone HemW [Jeotgalibacillus proteolyticus]PPA71466.1 coproporphyrinogen III oxidase [Jeotgalibacillus proteolyticus]
MVKAAYIHIPFCHHICHYCDFNKVFMKNQPVDLYIEKLIDEMKLRLSDSQEKFTTIFVGGGTPTALSAAQLEQLCSGIKAVLPFSDSVEYTFEANPGDLSKDKIDVLLRYGVNRLSFGVQSFTDELLKRIGRNHRSEDVYRSIREAREAGFSNISIDLIYSLPTQTLDDFEDTIDKALELNLPHYSGYSLIVEPKTVFYNLLRKGKLPLPGEETEARMYEMLMDKMKSAGYGQYEISNFAKPGFESKHNIVYWDNSEYFGFGAGAHGYVDGVRYSNIGPVGKYMEPIGRKEYPTLSANEVAENEKMEEEMFLGLRKTEGVSLSRFEKRYNKNLLELFSGSVEEMKAKGLLQVHGDYIRLTHKGRFLGNEVFQSFLGVI